MVSLPSVNQVIRTAVLVVVLFAIVRFMPEQVKSFFRV
jgi:hypothetical protein